MPKDSDLLLSFEETAALFRRRGIVEAFEQRSDMYAEYFIKL